MILAGTGHRPSKLNSEYDLQGPLSQWLRSQIRNIFNNFPIHKIISGMALGFDQILLEEALRQGIKVIAAIPCAGQEKLWPLEAQKRYHILLADPLVEPILVTKTGYTPKVMQVRNIWMVDNCDVLLAAWDGSSGGTANCVHYAETKNKKIIRLNPKDFKSLRE